ncbi:MAG: type I-E CRISPR-associated protein Cse2/CasB [Chloroflexota bacterium]
MSRPSEREAAFAAYMDQMSSKRKLAALAALRRGLGKRPGEAPEMFPYVVPWLPAKCGWWEERCFYAAASAFAVHQVSWSPAETSERTNFGASLARLAAKMETGGVERRFQAMLNCHRDDLPAHLAHLVTLLKSKEVPVDWAQLLHDIRQWGREDRAVQRDWAGAFWAVSEPDSGQAADVAATAERPTENATI